MNDRAPFAGGDQAYLRDEQYGDTAELDVRTALHQRFSTADVDFPVSRRHSSSGRGRPEFWSADRFEGFP